MLSTLARVGKALVACIGAAGAAAVTAGQDGTITSADWLTIVLAGITVGLATWGTPWTGPAGKGYEAPQG
jgi:hypothetical protein